MFDYAKRMCEIRGVIAKGPFQDTWESLSHFRTPTWFSKAKFGIFIHWGLYSVPAYRNEWYSRNMYVRNSPEYEYHRKKYGPQKDFGYKDFIPMFKAEKFDAAKWADLFKEAGAKYVVPVAEHHDGFQMYESELSKYNAVEMGPKRDVLGQLREAIEERDMTFCTSTHRAEHFWFMGVGREFESDITGEFTRGDFYWPSVAEQPDNYDMYATPYPTEEFLEDWICRTCEIVDKYRPAILYFDWWIMHDGYKDALRTIMAYYYNRASEWGMEVAVTYKHDALAFGSGIVEIERGTLPFAEPFVWQTDTAIARNSWCYVQDLEYKSAGEIVRVLCDAVSKNGNLLLNIGPMANGEIPKTDETILKEIGQWLSVNGEAIYESKPWRYCMEGPTKEGEGQFMDASETQYTPSDFRFTCANGCVYAIGMQTPKDGNICIQSLGTSKDATKPQFCGIISEVKILGYSGEIEYIVDEEGLHLKADIAYSTMPFVVKVKVN